MTRTPSGFTLILILAGALLMLTATGAHVATGASGWRWLVAAGAAVQVTGWLAHVRRNRRSGGAA
ncbi:hypothetical protein ACFQ8O_32405 [Streptomyces coelicoflavus]|uniref:hypothetical protein n=1 Tax=Streptomyces coelicoflavus TaxID=285562 RepID=UPI0036B1C200